MTIKNNKSLLYIAYHYPPILGSSGVHRTLAFSRYLSNQSWQVNLLTTNLDAYVQWDKSQFELIPEKVNVIRAFAKDTARHLSFKGKYSNWMAIPDRWQSWIPFGVFAGLLTIRKNRCKLIVSTYPIASAHIIAYLLHKITGLPWVADLRDPMAQTNYPDDPRVKKVFQWIENKMVKHCEKIIVTTKGTMELYLERFPNTSKNLWNMLPNGYDEELLDQYLGVKYQTPEKHKIRLLHSGIIYSVDRDPSHFFQALSELKKASPRLFVDIEIWLRATGADDYYDKLLTKFEIKDFVKLQPKLPFKEAIQDMQSANILLLLQASSANYQIPAKAYEYIRVGKPILALTDPTGDTASVMEKSNVAVIAPLNDVEKIKVAVVDIIKRYKANEFTFLSSEEVKQFSRESQAIIFEQLLSEINKN